MKPPASACTSHDLAEDATTSVSQVAMQPVATPVSAAPTAAPADVTAVVEPTVDLLDAFIEQLQSIVISQDLDAMQELMSNPIAVASWRSEGRMLEPAQTVDEFRNDALPAPTAVHFTDLSENELTGFTGQPPASLLGPAATVVAVLHSSGWGEEGNDEAILFVADENGRFVWSAFLYTSGSFYDSISQVDLITAAPIFTGGDLQFVDWSPDGRYLAYFEYTEEQVAQEATVGLRGTYPGTLVFFDTETGEKCTDYPFGGRFNHEGGESGSRWRWLPNGQLLLKLPDGRLLQTTAPCVQEGERAPRLGASISSIGSSSPDAQRLILVGEGKYWLYDWVDQSVHPLAEIQPDSMNNLVWSPDSRHISITLAGNYTGNRSAIGGTRVIDAATGEVIARHDWEPANALDGTFGGPVWISDEEFVVTLSLDQGPFLMNMAGEVKALLPTLFDEAFDPENYWPPLEVYADVESGRYAILRSNAAQAVAKLYIATLQEEWLEVFEQTSASFFILSDGTVGYEEYGRYWTRAVFDAGEPFMQQPLGYNPYQLSPGSRLRVTNEGDRLLIYDIESERIRAHLQLPGFEAGYHLDPIVSPDDQWLAVFVREPQYGYGQALFVISVP